MCRARELTVNVKRSFVTRVLQRRDETTRVHRVDDDAALRRGIGDAAQTRARVAAIVLDKKATGKKKHNLTPGQRLRRLHQRFKSRECVSVEVPGLRLNRL